MKKTSCLLALFFLVITLCAVPAVSAHDFGGIETTGQAELPQDFAFTVSDTCSGHDNFLQVSLREDGWFALCTRYTDMQKDPDSVYKIVYVDIYDAAGNFQLELSFYTPHYVAAELTGQAVNLYFDYYVVAYDLTTGELQCFSLPAHAAQEQGIYDALKKDRFSRNGWEYRCKKAVHGYREFSRTNGSETQILVSYSTPNSVRWRSALVIALALTVTILLLFRHKIQAFYSRLRKK